MSKPKTTKPSGKNIIANPTKEIVSSPREDVLNSILSILDKYGVYIIAALSIIVFLFRMHRLGFISLWVDEFVHCNDALHAVQGKPYLQEDKMGYLLTFSIIPFFKMFGISGAIARVPSVIYGVATIPLIYYLAKRLFNSYVGIFSSLLFSVSLYATFWGRIARNYSIFGFFNVLLLILFVWAFFPKRSDPLQRFNPSWSTQWGFSLIPIILLPIGLFLDLSSHPLAFIMAFPIITLIFLNGIYMAYSRKENKFKQIHIFLGGIGMAIMFLMLTPQGKPLLQGILLKFVVAANTDWVLPNWDLIKEKFNGEEKNFVRDFYIKVFSTDMPKYYMLGMYGALLPLLRKHFYSAIILLSFWIPFLVMSYIYREPNLPRYMYYLYPFVLISIAVFFNEVMYWIHKFIPVNKAIMAVAMALPLLYLYVPAQKSIALVNTKKQGQVVPQELSVWYFTSWNEALEQVAKQIKKEDIVLTTGPWATTFYLQRDNNLWWRQQSYDKATRQWIPFSPPQRDAKGNGATSYEDLVKTFNNNKRGWLISDYYLYNITTDPKCRDFVFKNMHHHFNSSADGSVDFFSWDKDNPLPTQNFVMVLGKNDNQLAGMPLNFTLGAVPPQGISLVVTTEGIDNDQEVIAVINSQHSIYMPKNIKAMRGDITLPIPSEWLTPGQNTIQFGYNPDTPLTSEQQRGAAVYDLKF
jgi:hypothetical protein